MPQLKTEPRFFSANAVDRVFAAEPGDVTVAAAPCRNESRYLGQEFGADAELTSLKLAAVLGVVSKLSCSACTSARQMEPIINAVGHGGNCLPLVMFEFLKAFDSTMHPVTKSSPIPTRNS